MDGETRFGYNKNELFRIDSFNHVKDPNRPETTPYGRRVPFISFPGIPALAREIQSRGAAPTLSFEQQLALVKGPRDEAWRHLLPSGWQPPR